MTARGKGPSYRTHAGRGLCCGCWRWAVRHGALLDYERCNRSRGELLDEYVLLRDQGYTWRHCAQRLGMSYPTFEMAMYRARADRDPRAGRIGEDWPPAWPDRRAAS